MYSANTLTIPEDSFCVIVNEEQLKLLEKVLTSPRLLPENADVRQSSQFLSAHNEIDVDNGLMQEFQQKHNKLKQVLNEIRKEFSAEELRSNVGSTDNYKRFSSLRKEFRSWYRTCQVTQKHILQIKHGVPFHLVNAHITLSPNPLTTVKKQELMNKIYDTLDAHSAEIFNNIMSHNISQIDKLTNDLQFFEDHVIAKAYRATVLGFKDFSDGEIMKSLNKENKQHTTKPPPIKHAQSQKTKTFPVFSSHNYAEDFPPLPKTSNKMSKTVSGANKKCTIEISPSSPSYPSKCRNSKTTAFKYQHSSKQFWQK